MTELEKSRQEKLQYQLTYGRGIFTSEWDELIELRKKSLEEKGLNPNDFDLESRNCTKKN